MSADTCPNCGKPHKLIGPRCECGENQTTWYEELCRQGVVSTGSPAVPIGVLEHVAQAWRMRAEALRSEAKTLKLNTRWQGRKRRFLAAQLDSLAKELDLLTEAATVRQPQENTEASRGA